jgi:glycerol dehydrogenase-like iron-containing ADH family enzyme
MSSSDKLFPIIYGRNLVNELPYFVHRPYLVVTMQDLWPKFSASFDGNMASVYFVQSLEQRRLEADIARLPACGSVVGLGGGQALDVAKCISWSRRIPLFQVPTALTVDAAFGHRFAVRVGGQVQYIGWAVPEAIYVDYDVIQGAPPLLNRSGVGDILCYYTAHADWQLAHARGKTEPQWPHDPQLIKEAQTVLVSVVNALDEIREGTQVGIRTLAEALRWGGAAYHNAGWNPRHVEGVEHFFFYALEYHTGRKFVHGQPVCLGVYLGSAIHESIALSVRSAGRLCPPAKEMLATIHQAGVDIRPEAMGITWDQVAGTLHNLHLFVTNSDLPYTAANEARITNAFIEQSRRHIEATFGPWTGPHT